MTLAVALSALALTAAGCSEQQPAGGSKAEGASTSADQGTPPPVRRADPAEDERFVHELESSGGKAFGTPADTANLGRAACNDLRSGGYEAAMDSVQPAGFPSEEEATTFIEAAKKALCPDMAGVTP